MNKTKILITGVFFALVILLCLPSVTLPVQPAETLASESVGSDDPFRQVIPLETGTAGTPDNSAAILLSQEGDDLIARKPELFAHTVMLKFLDAPSLKASLENMVSEYGIITADKRSNSLIICDTNDVSKKIMEEIRKADRTPPQLLIEVVIVDVQLKDEKEIGINWDILSDTIYDASYRQNFTTRLGSTGSTTTTIGNATAFNTTGSGGDFAVVSGNVRTVVHALQEKKNVEILASPRVMVLSGESASIETVEEIPYQQQSQTSGGGALTSTEFKLVGIKLQVTATVTDDNEILLTIQPEQNVNTGVFGIDDIPIIDTRKAQTTLLLNDGQVVIFGGLRRTEKTYQISQIPILGDIPIIGELFRDRKNITKHSELIVFLSPHICKNTLPTAEQMKKFDQAKASDKPILGLPDEKSLFFNGQPPKPKQK